MCFSAGHANDSSEKVERYPTTDGGYSLPPGIDLRWCFFGFRETPVSFGLFSSGPAVLRRGGTYPAAPLRTLSRRDLFFVADDKVLSDLNRGEVDPGKACTCIQREKFEPRLAI